MFEHEIVSLPSASALAVLRRDTAGREHAGKTIAVLADPVFDREDPRVRLREEPKQPALKRSLQNDRPGKSYERCGAARQQG